MRRIVLVDDHALFRAGVRGELGEAVEIVGEAGSVSEAVPLIHEEGNPEHRCGAARPNRAVADEDDRQARRDEAETEDGGERQPECDEKHRRRSRDEERAASCTTVSVELKREVEEDARAARKGEQREDEANDCRVHTERRGETATDAGEDAILVARLELQCRDAAQGAARSTRISPAPTEASITSLAPRPDVRLAFRPSS